MSKINCVVVDDEPLALKLLVSYINKVDELILVGSFTDALEALKFCNTHTVDLVFLDIQMPQLTGIQLSKLIEGPKIVFVTAYPDFAVEGFELEALDYIVKPVTFDRFLKAVNRFTQHSSESKHISTTTKEFIFVRSEHKSIRVDLDNILYLKGMGDYVDIKLIDGRLLTLQNLKDFELDLPADRFVRIHKSYIVSVSKIDYIENGKVNVGGVVINIGPTYSAKIKQLFDKN